MSITGERDIEGLKRVGAIACEMLQRMPAAAFSVPGGAELADALSAY